MTGRIRARTGGPGSVAVGLRRRDGGVRERAEGDANRLRRVEPRVILIPDVCGAGQRGSRAFLLPGPRRGTLPSAMERGAAPGGGSGATTWLRSHGCPAGNHWGHSVSPAFFGVFSFLMQFFGVFFPLCSLTRSLVIIRSVACIAEAFGSVCTAKSFGLHACTRP